MWDPSSLTRDWTHTLCSGRQSLFLSVCLLWVFIAVRGLFSSCDEWALLSSCRAQNSYCSGFSCSRASALERRPSSCGTRAKFPRGIWDLPGLGVKSKSPALASWLITTGPPGKSLSGSLSRAIYPAKDICQNLWMFLVLTMTRDTGV